MILVKILSAFFEVPGIFVTLCIIMFFYYLKKEKRIRKFLLIITIIVYIISTGWFARLFVTPLENAYQPFELQGKFLDDSKGLIVVLGGGVISNTPLDNIGELSDQSLQRIYNSYILYKNLGYPMVVTGGKLPETDNLPEAFKMKEVLIKLGVPPADIYIESNARNTEENAKYTADVIENLGINKVYLVTSAIHMKRAVKVFKNNISVELIPVPVNYMISRNNISWYDFLPKIEFLKATSAAWHEILGNLFYSL